MNLVGHAMFSLCLCCYLIFLNSCRELALLCLACVLPSPLCLNQDGVRNKGTTEPGQPQRGTPATPGRQYGADPLSSP